jgi:regulatory protein YycI of two-component signal transduction system YycFG
VYNEANLSAVSFSVVSAGRRYSLRSSDKSTRATMQYQTYDNGFSWRNCHQSNLRSLETKGRMRRTLVANNSGKPYGAKPEKKVTKLRNHASS